MEMKLATTLHTAIPEHRGRLQPIHVRWPLHRPLGQHGRLVPARLAQNHLGLAHWIGRAERRDLCASGHDSARHLLCRRR